MSLKSSLNKPIKALLGLPHQTKPGDIGIEVELEGNLRQVPGVVWSSKPENSLRNGGFEFVLTKPLTIDVIPIALKLFDETMRKCQPHASIRCSTHIHVNVFEMTLKQVMYAASAYYLFEEALVQTQTTNRHANLFCLTLSKAEDLFTSIVEALHQTSFLEVFGEERNRYAALNLASLRKFGSLEFRFLDAMTTAHDLQLWVDILYNLVHNTKDLPPHKFLAAFDELSIPEFLERFLGSNAAAFLQSRYSKEKLHSLLLTNYDYVHALGETFETKGSFRMPSAYWTEDGPGVGSEMGTGGQSSMSAYMAHIAELASLGTPAAQPAQHAVPPSPYPWGSTVMTNNAPLQGQTADLHIFDDEVYMTPEGDEVGF